MLFAKSLPKENIKSRVQFELFRFKATYLKNKKRIKRRRRNFARQLSRFSTVGLSISFFNKEL
jgi:hypothetical protein